MNIKEFWEKNLEFNTDLAKELEPYTDRKVSELSESLKKDLQKIRLGPRITSSGLESVNSIVSQLYLINASIKFALRDPEGFMKKYGKKTEGKESAPRKQKSQEQKNIQIKIKPKIISKLEPKITIKLASDVPPPSSQIDL